MFYKVNKVKALDDYVLLIEFINGKIKEYDVKFLFDKFESFNELKIDGLFEQVTVDVGGYGVSWNDRIDLSCNELYEGGIEVGEKVG